MSEGDDDDGGGGDEDEAGEVRLERPELVSPVEYAESKANPIWCCNGLFSA